MPHLIPNLTTRRFIRAVTGCALIIAAVTALWGADRALARRAYAESWCAFPIEAHEWGVMAFDASGAPLHGLVPLPSWIYQRASVDPSRDVKPVVSPVRDLPSDSGERDLPVVQFYAPHRWSDVIPLGLEVGFSRGVATAWFPQVDGLRSAAEANSPGAATARDRLLKRRAERVPFVPSTEHLPSDPTRQLIWEALSLSVNPPASLNPPLQPWVEALRASPDALWVSSGADAERFVFYEGRSAEHPMLTLQPLAAPPAAGSCACEAQNTDTFPLYDVLIISRDPADPSGLARVGFAPVIAPGAAVTIPLSAPLDPKALKSATEDRLLTRLTSAPDADVDVLPADGTSGSPVAPDCASPRDPAIPTEASTSHTLHPPEALALLSAWGPHLFSQPFITTVYRESPARIDAVMPLSLYTDMYHEVQLHRVGLVTQRSLPLSACACTP
jgi:hypothetical protein